MKIAALAEDCSAIYRLGTASKAMPALLYRHTRRYNQRYRKIGHLLQGRYKAILCDRDSYLMELIRYLHSNPVLAGVVSDPSRYSWSSH